MKVVLDSNVVMAVFLWSGSCTQFFELANAGIIEPYTSRELLDEINDVFTDLSTPSMLPVQGLPPNNSLTNISVLPNAFQHKNSRNKFAVMPTMMMFSPARSQLMPV